VGKAPAFQWYPNDWLRDTQAATATVRGIWIDLLCAMWWSATRGTLTGTEAELCRFGRCTPEEWGQFLEQNTRLKFADVTISDGLVTVSNRRMVREESDRESTRCRVQRFRKRPCNADVTVPSPTPVSDLRSPSTSDPEKTLGAVVPDDRDAPAPVEAAGSPPAAPWPDRIVPIQARLLELQAPDDLMDAGYWLRIDDWIGPMKLPVYYLDELRAYLAYQAGLNGRRRHKDHRAGFRNWLATAVRWKERDAQRTALRSRS